MSPVSSAWYERVDPRQLLDPPALAPAAPLGERVLEVGVGVGGEHGDAQNGTPAACVINARRSPL
jgi:hypothetical protein